MLTVQDCLAMCELTEEEVRAIAQHEHIPEVVAAELGNYLVHTSTGEQEIEHMIADDIAEARDAGDLRRAAELKLVLRHFAETHALPGA
jgi:S-ribosylhomocysteine lyase LuxS involved in autoinducer biosynthesis